MAKAGLRVAETHLDTSPGIVTSRNLSTPEGAPLYAEARLSNNHRLLAIMIMILILVVIVLAGAISARALGIPRLLPGVPGYTQAGPRILIAELGFLPRRNPTRVPGTSVTVGIPVTNPGTRVPRVPGYSVTDVSASDDLQLDAPRCTIARTD
eukprot:1243205-Rhodomonas_salina.1